MELSEKARGKLPVRLSDEAAVLARLDAEPSDYWKVISEAENVSADILHAVDTLRRDALSRPGYDDDYFSDVKQVRDALCRVLERLARLVEAWEGDPRPISGRACFPAGLPSWFDDVLENTRRMRQSLLEKHTGLSKIHVVTWHPEEFRSVMELDQLAHEMGTTLDEAAEKGFQFVDSPSQPGKLSATYRPSRTTLTTNNRRGAAGDGDPGSWRSASRRLAGCVSPPATRQVSGPTQRGPLADSRAVERFVRGRLVHYSSIQPKTARLPKILADIRHLDTRDRRLADALRAALRNALPRCDKAGNDGEISGGTGGQDSSGGEGPSPPDAVRPHGRQVDRLGRVS